MSSAASSTNGSLFFIAILVIVILLRIRRVINGTRVSLSRTIGYSLYYVVFAALFLSGSFFIGIPKEFFVIYPVLFLASFYSAYNIARKRLVFWKLSDGTIYSKGGLAVYITYIVGLVARIVIGYIYIGPDFLFTTTPAQSLSGTAIIATLATDLILVFGAGLLFGRNMQILRRYFAFKSGKETIPELDTGHS